MTPWERHELRLRRQAEFRRFDEWCLAHPWKARILAVGIAIFVGELAMLLRIALDALAKDGAS